MTGTDYRDEVASSMPTGAGWRRFGRPMAALTSAGGAEAIAGFVATLVLAHVTSVAEAGRVFFAQAAVGLVFNVLDPRLEDAVIRFAPRLPARQAAGLFRRCLLLDVALGAVGGVLAVAVVLNVGETRLIEPTYLLLAIAASSVAAGYGTASAAFSITDGLPLLGHIRLIVAALGVPVVVAGALAFGAHGFLLAQGLLALVSTGAIVVIAGRRVRRRYGDAQPVRLAGIQGLVPFTAKASAGTTLLSALDRLPLAVLGLVAGPVSVALFRVGLTPARLLVTLTSPISAVLFPWLAQQSALGQVSTLRSPLRRASLLALPAALLLSALAVPLLDVLIPAWFGTKYEAAVPVASLLLLAAALRSCVPWTKVLLLALGRPGLRLVVVAADGLAVTLVTLLLGASVVAVAIGHVAVAVAVVAAWLVIAEWALARDGTAASVVTVGDNK